ncbi:MAG: hypothetical protein AAFP19_03615 [Bacteroidota bacterium]
MKVLNVHKRIIDQPLEKVAGLLSTLATKEDKIWPKEQWPPMRFKEGLKVGSKGGHGPIRYTVVEKIPGQLIRFNFTQPRQFKGEHCLEINAVSDTKTEVKHVIDMQTQGLGILSWTLAIRHLHDALIEDALDKIENYFSTNKRRTAWSLWVKFLRMVLR